MSLSQQSKKVQAAFWTTLTTLMGAIAAWLIAHSAPVPTASLPRDIEAAKRVLDAAQKDEQNQPTLEPTELRIRKLAADIKNLRDERGSDRALIDWLWFELYQEISRRVQLEALIRQPKNKTAAGDALELYKDRAAGWGACPATPLAFEELKSKAKSMSMNAAGDSALRGMKISIER